MSSIKAQGKREKYIISVLRRGSYRYWEIADALRAARRGYGIYECAACGKTYPRKNVQRDHITPVVDPKLSYTTWDDLIDRLYCNKDGIQILCRPCHNEKSASENKGRKRKVKKKIKRKA